MHRVRRRSWAVGASTLLLLAVLASGADAACTAAGRTKVAVKFAPPTGQDIAGVKVVLDYPETSVAIPGWQNEPGVKARVADVPATFLSAPNDTDTELIMAIAGMSVLPAATIFTVDFDRCKGTPAVSAGDFHCEVKEASTPKGELVDGATCSVQIISDATQAASVEKHASQSKRGKSK